MIRSACAVIVVGGKYAMQLRDQNTRVLPGQWGLFGGSIEPGESSLLAIKRELLEELELYTNPVYLADLTPVRFFVVDATKDWPRHVLHEGQAAGLFSEQDVLALPLNYHTRAAINLHRSGLCA